METSVEGLCNLLARSHLLSSTDLRAMYQRWRSEAREATADLNRFTRWLVAQQYLTEYQVGALLRGHAERFFLNEYKLLDRIGKGRMAGVYKAVHRLGHIVAIKVLPPSRAKDPYQFARFQREARLALRLDHPNVVRTFHTGDADGLYYLVMEYLEGETFEEILQRRSQLPPAEAVRLLHQAFLGLQHIHEEGLIHRDFKPGNLMLVPADVADLAVTTFHTTVKILDIGLGRALFDEGTPASGQARPGKRVELTNEGDLLGTPDYMAPEQARDARTVDIRADIYSLGAVLYHALAGQPPFPEINLLKQIMRHATEAPWPVREFNPAVPEGLQQAINKMLAKDPAQRFPTPAAAARALEPFLGSAAGQQARAMGAEMQAYLKWLASRNADGAATATPPEAIPVALPAASVRAEQAIPALASPPSPGEFTPRGHLGSRDLIFFALGAGGVLLVEALIWLLL
jgi:serine/threonine protein kinase